MKRWSSISGSASDWPRPPLATNQHRWNPSWLCNLILPLDQERHQWTPFVLATAQGPAGTALARGTSRGGTFLSVLPSFSLIQNTKKWHGNAAFRHQNQAGRIYRVLYRIIWFIHWHTHSTRKFSYWPALPCFTSFYLVLSDFFIYTLIWLFRSKDLPIYPVLPSFT